MRLVPHVMGWNVPCPNNVVDIGMCPTDLIKHWFHCLTWGVALPIVTPYTRSEMRTGWFGSTGNTTTKRLIALCIGARLIERIPMSVRYLQHFKLWSFGLCTKKNTFIYSHFHVTFILNAPNQSNQIKCYTAWYQTTCFLKCLDWKRNTGIALLWHLFRHSTLQFFNFHTTA